MLQKNYKIVSWMHCFTKNQQHVSSKQRFHINATRCCRRTLWRIVEPRRTNPTTEIKQISAKRFFVVEFHSHDLLWPVLQRLWSGNSLNLNQCFGSGCYSNKARYPEIHGRPFGRTKENNGVPHESKNQQVFRIRLVAVTWLSRLIKG